MGKGFNNYMCKKFFHPASRDNVKRVWIAEQKVESAKKKQEELRIQYEKEQDLYNNKALLWKDSKEKLSLNFMYEPPPGLVKEKQKSEPEEETETKFEWQRKFNAPREDYCKGDDQIRDQPFGIRVRNVRCIKCHKWGHLNTDKECPLFKNAVDNDKEAQVSVHPSVLVKQMKDDGLAFKNHNFDISNGLIHSTEMKSEGSESDYESENNSENEADNSSPSSNHSSNNGNSSPSSSSSSSSNGNAENGSINGVEMDTDDEYEEDIQYINELCEEDKFLLLAALRKIEVLEQQQGRQNGIC